MKNNCQLLLGMACKGAGKAYEYSHKRASQGCRDRNALHPECTNINILVVMLHTVLQDVTHWKIMHKVHSTLPDYCL